MSWIWKSESLPYKMGNTGKKRFTKCSIKKSQMGLLTTHTNSGQLLLHCLCLVQVTKSVKAKHQHQHLRLILPFKVWRKLDAGLWYCYFVRFGPSLGDKFKITVKYLSTLFQGSWSDVPHRLESWPKKRLRDERKIQKRDRMSGALFGGCTTGLNQMTKKYFKMWSFSPVFLLQSGS